MRPRQEVPHALISIDFIVSRLKIDTRHTFVDCDLCGLQSSGFFGELPSKENDNQLPFLQVLL